MCEGLRHVVERGELWTLALNLNQNLPGRCVLVLNRHCERVSELTAEEWAGLHSYIARVTAALKDLFAPDQYNFAFLMNLDAHVHLHVVPRYASRREWRGETYADPHWGSLFGTEERLATEETLKALADAVKGRL
ncbi:MAG: HIT family protein [Actinomycetota bacterium]|nr:HIT family protein [Actinomycetota bacterium]